MAKYKPPNQELSKKRNKTGYNMFFSAHVNRLKQSDSGVPSERGSVARLVGTAWKRLPAEEKARYEREADQHNGMSPSKDDEEHEEEPNNSIIQPPLDNYHQQLFPPELHIAAQQQPPLAALLHDHRNLAQHAYYAPAPPIYNPFGYDYSQHQRHQQARAQGYHQGLFGTHLGYDRGI